MHLHVQVRTDSGVHTFKQRTETTVFTEAGHAGWVMHTHRTGQPTMAPQQHNQRLHKYLRGTNYAEQVARSRPFINA